MRAARVGFVLVYIDEAHSTRWPVALPDTPAPQADMADRLARARAFGRAHVSGLDAFELYADSWDPAASFGEAFRAWPDAYYCLSPDLEVVARSEYTREDALLDEDCTAVIARLCSARGC
jgi:hypothetical protein